MATTIGILETRGIARGAACADAMLKAADVSLLRAGVVCPGKHVTMIEGEVSAVSAAVGAGAAEAASALMGQCVLARVDDAVAAAIRGARVPIDYDSVAIVEFTGIAGAVWAADAVVKAADVALVRLRLANGIGGKAYFVLAGEVSAVSAAAEAAASLPTTVGRFIDSVIIPRPDEDLFRTFL